MTKETEKAFVILYSEYIRRRSFGTAKNQAVRFEDAKLRQIEAFSTWNPQDIRYCVEELRNLGYVKQNILDDVTLLESGIEYMESKPKEYFSSFARIINGILDLVSAFL